MTVYLTELKHVCDQLTSIRSPVSERMKIFAALQGLGKDYEPLITSIEGSIDMLPDPTLEDMIPRIQSYDARIQRENALSDVSPHLAFNAERSNYQAAYYSTRGRGQSNRRFGSNRGRGSFSLEEEGFISSYLLLQGLGLFCLLHLFPQMTDPPVRFVEDSITLL